MNQFLKLLLAIVGGVVGGLLWGVFACMLIGEAEAYAVMMPVFAIGSAIIALLGGLLFLKCGEPLDDVSSFTTAGALIAIGVYLMAVVVGVFFMGVTRPPNMSGLLFLAVIHGVPTGACAALAAKLFLNRQTDE